MEININPIGIGTYNLDLENAESTLNALLYSVNKGQNFISTSLIYNNYNVVNFLNNFFKKNRQKKYFSYLPSRSFHRKKRRC